MKRVISVLLCIVMLLGTMSLSVFAEKYYAGKAVSTAPKTDGVINDGEYTWTSGKLSTTKPIEGVISAGQETPQATMVEFFLAHDKDYVYVAYREKSTSTKTKLYFDLNPRAGFSESQGQILCGASLSDGVATCGATECVSASERPDKKDVYVSAVAGTSNSGSNVIEVKFNRKALETYAGKAFDVLGFRAIYQNFSTGDKEAFYYADTNSTAKPFWFATGQGYHIVNLNNNGTNPTIPEYEPVEPTPAESTPAESTHEHEYGKWKRMGMTHHKRVCADCGEEDYDFHVWGSPEVTREATAEKDGQVKYTCELCSTTTRDDVPFGTEVNLSPESDVPQTSAPSGDDTPATDAPLTDAPAEGGCGASVAAACVALVATLGTCTVFINKKK